MEKDIKTAILKEVKAKIQLGDINHAECLLKGYLSYEHKDPEISSILAKIYEQKGELKQALKVLKDQNSNYFCVFEELVKIYIKLEKYNRLYDIWKENNQRNFQDVKTKKQINDAKNYLRRTQILLKSLNKGVEVPKDLSYKERQYLNYNYKQALEHIIERHTTIDNNLTNKGTLFFNRYDIEELFLAVSRNIDFKKRELKLDYTYSDCYIFKYEKIGRNPLNNRILNYFRVATIPNTNKIITMYPVSKKISSNACYLTETDKLPICNSIIHTDKVYRVKTYSLKKKKK